jgi:hypothetical protein
LIRIRSIKGDLVELFFNPRERDEGLRCGENLLLRERDGDGGLVVQVIGLETVSYPALIREQMELAAEGGELPPPELFETLPPESPMLLGNLLVARAKIRKVTEGHNGGARWRHWDGWIPTRDVVVERVPDQEVAENCLSDRGHLLELGKMRGGRDMLIEGRDLEKVNIITGVKGAGKSHLAKVILLELIKLGAPTIVFDLNREYVHLPKHNVNPVSGSGERGVLVLSAGGNLKLDVVQFGLVPLSNMLAKFGLPEISLLYFENRLRRLLAEVKDWERMGRKPPFLGVPQLIQMAQEGEFATGMNAPAVNGAIASRLRALMETGMFAENEAEVTNLKSYYKLVRNGGAIVIDISHLGNRARSGLVQAVIEVVKEICQEEIARGSHRFPFLFFEEAHLYVSKASIDYLVTRARHLGASSVFITNMIGGLDEAVLRQADNLFLLRLPFEDDVRHVAKSAKTDYETLSSFVRRLPDHHALAIGEVTRGYPLIFRVDPLRGVNTAGETKLLFGDGLRPGDSGLGGFKPAEVPNRKLPRPAQGRLFDALR